MNRTLLVGAVLAAASLTGCCRMCCWQRGGHFDKGNCYPPTAPVGYAAPQVYAPQAGVVTPQPVIQQQTFAAPVAPCTCY